MLKNNSYGDSSHGTSNSCKVQSGVHPVMPRAVTTLLSSKVLASLPSTTSLLLSHDLHDPLLRVELHLLSLEPLLLSSKLQLLSYSQQQSLSFVNGCPLSGLQTHIIGQGHATTKIFNFIRNVVVMGQMLFLDSMEKNNFQLVDGYPICTFSSFCELVGYFFS